MRERKRYVKRESQREERCDEKERIVFVRETERERERQREREKVISVRGE